MTTETEDYAGAMPTGWTGGTHFPKWWRGKIVHLYTLTRKCDQCGNEMRLDVTKAALEGKAKNAGMHLKRCAGCRAKARALGATSRPRVEGEIVPRRTVETEISYITDETLRTANATMKEELEALYATTAELRKTVAELRKRLAKYELTPAMEAVANGPRMPWEQ